MSRKRKDNPTPSDPADSGNEGEGTAADTPQGGQFLVYQGEDGRMKIDVRLENETVWLTQQNMADLFQTTQQNISLHLQNIYEEGELQRAATHKEYLSVRQEGKRQVKRPLDFYNLVEQYLVFAEGQAMRRVPMHMNDWITKLHGFLTLNDRAILTHTGKISHELAKELAEAQYDKFHSAQIAQADQAGGDFDQAVKQLSPPPKKKRGKK